MMKDKQPILSICIPTYNRAELLDRTLGDLCSYLQDGLLFELIVCDNCSTDNTRAVIQKWAEKIQRLTVVSHNANLGYDRNVVSGWNVSKTKYCWLLGNQVSITFDNLARILTILEENAPHALILRATNYMHISSCEYTDLNRLLFDQGWQITNLSSFIVCNEALHPQFYSRYIDTAFVHYGTLIEYLASKNDLKVLYVKDVCLDFIPNTISKNNWRKTPFSIFGKNWLSLNLSLPSSIPLSTKMHVVRSHDDNVNVFSIKSLVISKSIYGSDYSQDYFENREYYSYVTRTSRFITDVLMFLPIEHVYKLYYRIKCIIKHR